jgi:hypothetical protein
MSVIRGGVILRSGDVLCWSVRLKDRLDDPRGGWMGADKNSSSKNSAYVPIATPKVTHKHQSQRQRSYGSTTSPRNDSSKHMRNH